MFKMSFILSWHTDNIPKHVAGTEYVSLSVVLDCNLHPVNEWYASGKFLEPGLTHSTLQTLIPYCSRQDFLVSKRLQAIMDLVDNM